MATITLQLGEQYIDPPGDGVLGTLSFEDNECWGEFLVTFKTTTNAWIEWVESGPGIAVAKVGGPTINGEQLTSNENYDIRVDSFKSPDDYLNRELSQVVFTLKDVEGGIVLDTATVSRRGTGIVC